MAFTRNFNTPLSMTRAMNKLLRRGYKVIGGMVKGVIATLESEDGSEVITLVCKA